MTKKFDEETQDEICDTVFRNWWNLLDCRQKELYYSLDDELVICGAEC